MKDERWPVHEPRLVVRRELVRGLGLDAALASHGWAEGLGWGRLDSLGREFLQQVEERHFRAPSNILGFVTFKIAWASRSGRVVHILIRILAVGSVERRLY